VLRAARVVPAGRVGVVDLFGNVRAEALPSGLHLVNPLARVHRMSVQTNEVKETMDSFQKIVAEGINENLLKWKGIEATKELALSGNSKVVIIGAGKEGLPIILGGDTSAEKHAPALLARSAFCRLNVSAIARQVISSRWRAIEPGVLVGKAK